MVLTMFLQKCSYKYIVFAISCGAAVN